MLATDDEWHQVSSASKAILTSHLYKPQHGRLSLVEVGPPFSFVQAAAVGSLSTFFSPLVHVRLLSQDGHRSSIQLHFPRPRRYCSIKIQK